VCYLSRRYFGIWILSIFALVVYLYDANAAMLELSWLDNSGDEDGFNIERKPGTRGAYARVATVGVNVTSYSDSNLTEGTTYCYRVNAFNSAGRSPYSPEVCGTARANSIPSYNLTVSIQGTGSVTTNPAGISCGTSCSGGFASGTSVLLQTVPGQGYSFSGWSGDSDCADGNLTMDNNKSCIATFTPNTTNNPPGTDLTLTVQVIGTITSGGKGSGKVVSRPRGINCGSHCSATFKSGVVVTLRARPGRGSDFAGWSGDSDCSDGTVTINTNVSCTATFQPQTSALSVSFAGSGMGTVSGHLSGISCNTSCNVSVAKGTTVQLTATPSADSFFSGWSGDRDCKDGVLRMKRDKSCTAVFTKRIPSNIGIYRRSTGAWYLTTTAALGWQGCDVDQCLGPFGNLTDLPIMGDWDGSGSEKAGLYAPDQRAWTLVVNGAIGNQGCDSGNCPGFTVPQTSSSQQLPVTGNWDGSNKDAVGIYQLAPNPKGTKIARQPDRQWSEASISDATEAEGQIGYWYLDGNGNGTWDGCKADRCFGPIGGTGDIPVVGDWNGGGVAKAGVFDPTTGMWDLDYNGNGKWNGCRRDWCMGPFGISGDIPVAGDWDGNGTFEIGVFRPSTGEWFLDYNGNGQWDGPTVDKYISGFGQEGDLPVVGKW
jgi:hypothetical protein